MDQHVLLQVHLSSRRICFQARSTRSLISRHWREEKGLLRQNGQKVGEFHSVVSLNMLLILLEDGGDEHASTFAFHGDELLDERLILIKSWSIIYDRRGQLVDARLSDGAN